MCGLSYELAFITLSTYFTLFCTNIMGIAAGALTSLFLISNCVDAVTDVVITNAADKAKSKMGHYRPWILICGACLGIMLFLDFLNPSFLKTDMHKLIYIYIVYLLSFPVFATGVMCPSYALGTVITGNKNERRCLSSVRAVGETAGDILCNSLAMGIILMFGGIGSVYGWRVMGALFGAVIILSSFLGSTGTRERINACRTDKPEANMSVFQKIIHLKKVKEVYIVIGIIAFISIENPFSASFFSYFCIYNLGHEEWLSILFTVCLIIQAVTNMTVPGLGKRLGNRRLLYLAIILLLTGYLMTFWVKGFYGALLMMILRGMGHGIAFPSMYAFVPELTDTVKEKTDVYMPGLCSAAVSFAVKVANGVGMSLATAALALAGFSASLMQQTVETQILFRIFYAVIPAACLTAAFICTFLLKEGSSNIRSVSK